MVISMMPNTITASTGMATANTSAQRTSMMKAMIIAPNTMKGERRNKRSARLTPDCTWLMSLVMRVMSVEVPMRSRSAKPSFWMWANTAWRSFVARPTAAFAAKYWAVTLLARPIRPSSTRTAPMHRM